MLDRLFKKETIQPSQPQQASMPQVVVEAADDIQSTLMFFAAMPRDNFQQRYLMKRVTMHPDDGKEPKTLKPEIILIFSCQTLKSEGKEMEARFRHEFDKAAKVWESTDKLAISFSMQGDQVVYGLETQIGATAESSTTQLQQDVLDAIALFLARTSPGTVKKVEKLHKAARTGPFLE
jgi:hypothetical protein